MKGSYFNLVKNYIKYLDNLKIDLKVQSFMFIYMIFIKA